MAMFVSRLPVGMPRSELEKVHVGKSAVRSAREERKRERETGSRRGAIEYKY